jgi:hypothetical protein
VNLQKLILEGVCRILVNEMTKLRIEINLNEKKKKMETNNLSGVNMKSIRSTDMKERLR